jgi:hypothetical protein
VNASNISLALDICNQTKLCDGSKPPLAPPLRQSPDALDGVYLQMRFLVNEKCYILEVEPLNILEVRPLKVWIWILAICGCLGKAARRRLLKRGGIITRLRCTKCAGYFNGQVSEFKMSIMESIGKGSHGGRGTI